MTFLLDRSMFHTRFGAVPVDKASFRESSSVFVAYVWSSSGAYFAQSGWSETANFGVKFKKGDRITVRLDIDANTVAFRKNGVDVGSPQDIASGAYNFLFEAEWSGDRVTIVEAV